MKTIIKIVGYNFMFFIIVFMFSCADLVNRGSRQIAFATDTVMYYARQKTQIHQGVYDATTNKTYIVYPAGIKNGYSACSPYIIYFNHSTKTWSNPVNIFESPVEPDSHNYPQILIDDSGYLHVFQTYHNNHPISHAVSKTPYDIENWTVTEIENTEKNTYGAGFKAKNGDMYLLFRGVDGTNPSYKPEYYIKSVDNGNNWSIHKLIDPYPIYDNWGTVFTKALHYEESSEGLHITFGVHQYHNINIDKHYYVFFSFNDNHLYSVNGTDLGTSIDVNEMNDYCLLFEYGEPISFFNVRMALDLDDKNNPIIFYNRKDNSNKMYIEMAHWDNNWKFTKTGLSGGVFCYELEIISDSIFNLYTISGYRRTVSVIHFVDNNISGKSTIIDKLPSNSEGEFEHLTFISNYHPDIKGIYMEGQYSYWSKPNSNGRIFSFNEKLVISY